MFKSPQHSKRRLAAEIGPRAQAAAEHLLACALADLDAWDGPTCLAPADARDLHGVDHRAECCAEQGSGNLGERIEHVNAAMLDAGHEAQLFIGSDCPGLDAEYLARAAAALAAADAVLGPAADGGVVLMGIRGRWPPLAQLPWSTASLHEELARSCERAALRIVTLEPRDDVDRARDLRQLPLTLQRDERPSRRRLCAWIESESLA